MSLSKKPYIVLIDDDVMTPEVAPLIDFLQIEYGDDRVVLFEEPEKGIAFVESHLSERIIVLLDLRFNGLHIGFDIFDKLASQSSLVCFIIMTGSAESARQEDLIKLINGHAWYLVTREADAETILGWVKKAADHLSMRVDGALEEWLLRQSPEDRQKPFIQNRDGEPYSLEDILIAIRTGNDPIGQEMVENILSVSISMLARDKSRIGN